MKYQNIIIGMFIAGIMWTLHIQNTKIDRLEQFYNLKLDKLTFTCNRGVAVMTPEGNATTVCAP